MDRFITPTRRWPAGWTVLHVYVLPDLDADTGLARLVGGCRQVLAEVPFVAPVADEWLHVTVQMIGDRPASDVSIEERHRLVDRLTTILADMAPFTVTVGPALATTSGVIADLDSELPGQRFHRLHHAVRIVIEDMFGAEAPHHNIFPPHLSLAYGTGPGDSGMVQSLLRRRVRPSHAAMTIRHVHLLDVTQDADTSAYRWTSVAAIPLGTATTDATP